MAPMLEAKSYSSYILRMLNDILSWHSNDENLNLDLYISIFDIFFSEKLNLSQSVIEEGIQSLKKLRVR